MFDLAADAAAAAAVVELEKRLGAVVLLSEESGRAVIGKGPIRALIVIDPVDGSDNWARGLPLSSVACAVIPRQDSALHPDAVEWAMVGPLESEIPLIARKGAGAWRGRERLSSSDVHRLEEAVISCELNHYAPSPSLQRLMARAAGVRSYGCASRALALVASGALDAHIDLRGRLTPESYLAGVRLLIEAGGMVVDPQGRPLPQTKHLTDRVSLVAAANERLATQILAGLNDHGG